MLVKLLHHKNIFLFTCENCVEFFVEHELFFFIQNTILQDEKARKDALEKMKSIIGW